MISLFLHLLALSYGTVNLCGTLEFMPLASVVAWSGLTILIIMRWLPGYVDAEVAAGRVPSFVKTQEKFFWGIVAWILLLHATADPVGLMLPDYVGVLPQILPMLVSIALYLGLAYPVMFEMYRLFKPVLDQRQSSRDFFRARMTIPILFFPPIMLWMLIEDLNGDGMPALVEIKLMAVAPVFFIALYLISPKLFNFAWRAEDNQYPDLEAAIKKISEQAEAPVSGLKIWDTFNEPVANAAVAGLSARFRYVYITRYLLSLFSAEQVEGVVAHELGHLRLGHVTTYMLYSIVLILVSVFYKLGIIAWFPQYYTESAWVSFAEMLFFLAVFSLTFTALARFSEYQADAFAVTLTDRQNFASGLETLESMTLPPPAVIPGWLLTHPLISDRIERARNGPAQTLPELIRQAGRTRLLLVIFGLAMLAAAFSPAAAVLKISDLHDAVQAGNHRLALSRYNSLPDSLKNHPMVLQETGKLAFGCGSPLLATAIAAETSLGLRFVEVSEILHHAGAPEVALDFEVMKFVLKPLDLWRVHGVSLLEKFFDHIKTALG